ncbi:MAG: ABC transporter permease [Bryobacteraceae bacterium]|jgi:predicted permease
MFRTLLSRIRAHFSAPQQDARLAEEINAHIDALAADYQRRGLTRQAALQAARREFGNVTHMQETHRAHRTLPSLNILAQDLRYAVRQMRANPGFAAAAVLTLAVGIGANTAIFQLLSSVIYRPLPVPEPHRLALLKVRANGTLGDFSYPVYREMAARQNVAEGIYASTYAPLIQSTLRTGSETRKVNATLVTGNYFQVLRAAVHLGRTLTPADDAPGAEPVAVISDAFFASQFSRKSDIVGRTIEINRIPITVIGVAAPSFYGDALSFNIDAWLPMSLQPRVMHQELLKDTQEFWLTSVARLKPGVSLARAQAALNALFHQVGTASLPQDSIQLSSAARGLTLLQDQYEAPLLMMMAVAALALLIACCNLANLLLGRSAARVHEIGVRLALGAGRWRVVRQLLTESLLLSAIGSVAALALASWAWRAVVVMAYGEGSASRASSDAGWPVLAFVAGVAVLSTSFFALAPALAATHMDIRSTLANNRSQTAGPSRQLFGKALIVTQVSVSLLLLSGAGLLLRSLYHLRHQDFGYRTQGVLVAELPLQFDDYESDAGRARHAALIQPLFDRVNALPGVQSAAVSCFGPMSSGQWTGRLSTPLQQEKNSQPVRVVAVSPRYFETMGIEILAGRPIAAEDQVKTPGVVVLSQTAARRLFGAGNPIGRLISEGDKYDAANAMQVVGVAHDMRFADPRDPFGVLAFIPLAQVADVPVTNIVLRTSADPAKYSGALREIVRQLDPSRSVGSIARLSDQIDDKLGDDSIVATLTSAFGILALALTCIGIYAVVGYAVARRTQEIGIRLALGASRGAISSMVIRDLGKLLAIATVLGCAGTIAAARALRDAFFGIGPLDLAVPVAAAALLSAVAVLAAYLPARRAARLDPMHALSGAGPWPAQSRAAHSARPRVGT